MKKGLLVVVTMLCLCCVGCLTQEITDPNTGLTHKVYSMDPNAAAQYEAIGEGAAGILSLFYPAAGGLAIGLLGMWRKLKPQLLEQTQKSEIAYKGGRALTTALEEIKDKQPELWDKISPYLSKIQQPASEIENIIRGFRGLDPK